MQSPRPFDLIIFDLDGTLYAPLAELDRVYPAVATRLAALSVGADPQCYAPVFEARRAELARLIGGKPTSTLTLMYFFDVDLTLYTDEVDRHLRIEELLLPDPATISVLTQVQASYPLYLYTTNNARSTERILQHLQLAQFFPPARRFTFSDILRLPLTRREQTRYVKPGTGGFELILQRCQTTADKTLMVGDSLASDIQPAQRLGMTTYHVTQPADLYRLAQWLGLADQPAITAS